MQRDRVRTGIDLGRHSVKLVRGRGGARLTRITHVGAEPLAAENGEKEEARAAEALRRLLTRLGLERRSLGHVAVALRGEEAGLREVLMPGLSAGEVQQAFPFEVRRHLNLEEMETPHTAYQILGVRPSASPAAMSAPDAGTRTGVLFAAVPDAQRAFALDVMAQVGVELEVLDLASLAALNALHAARDRTAGNGDPLCLLDLGGSRAAMHLAGPFGGLLSRVVGPGAPGTGDGRVLDEYAAAIAGGVSETLIFYRGRHRAEVRRVHLAGGGALTPGLTGKLAESLAREVAVLDPLVGLATGARGAQETESQGPLFVTACGLCRWWDQTDV